MQCPMCGARTDFDEYGTGASYYQKHTCLNPTCGYEFEADDNE